MICCLGGITLQQCAFGRAGELCPAKSSPVARVSLHFAGFPCCPSCVCSLPAPHRPANRAWDQRTKVSLSLPFLCPLSVLLYCLCWGLLHLSAEGTELAGMAWVGLSPSWSWHTLPGLHLPMQGCQKAAGRGQTELLGGCQGSVWAVEPFWPHQYVGTGSGGQGAVAWLHLAHGGSWL